LNQQARYYNWLVTKNIAMEQPTGTTGDKLTTAVAQLKKITIVLQKEREKYEAANRVLHELLERNELLQQSVLTTQQVAALCSLSPRKVRDYYKSKDLAAFRYHGGNRTALHFKLQDVLDFQDKALMGL
jgi:hypothetical protein